MSGASPKRINVFLCDTPFTAFLAEIIGRDLDGERWLFFTARARPAVNPQNWTKVVEFETPRLERRILVRTPLMRNLALVKDAVRGAADVQIFLSNIGEYNQNLIFFDSELSRRARYNMVFDGTGAITPSRMSLRVYLRKCLHWVVGRLGIGAPHTPFIGHMMHGRRKRIEKIYSPEFHFLNCPPEVKALIKLPTARIEQNETVLFADHPLNFLTADEEATLFKEMMHYLASRGFKRILYKKHHFQAMVPEGFGLKVEVIAEGRCIEAVFQDLGAAAIASFFSTSLLTTKLMFGDSVRSISFVNWVDRHGWLESHKAPHPAVVQGIRDIFSHYDVEMPAYVPVGATLASERK